MRRTPPTPQPDPVRDAEGHTGAAAAPPAGHGPRRAYTPPRLEPLGRLAEVTRFGGSQIVDSGGGLGQQL
jgi:hypothetical protein